MIKKEVIFIFAYYSYSDPIFQSAVLPYFKNFGANYQFIILTFEQKKYRLSNKAFSAIKSELRNEQITLYRTKWHSGRLKILKKVYDFLNGILKSQYIIRKHKIKAIYSEGFPGATIGHYLALLNNLPHIIHTFEPHAEYMVEAGVWTEKSWEYRLLKKTELKVANKAKVVFTATEAYQKILKSKGIKSNIRQVPSCVDTTLFQFSNKEREQVRNLLNYKENDIVICYLGKFGGMYMDDELFRFYRLCLDYSPKFKLLVISVDDGKNIYNLAKKANIGADQFNLIMLTRSEIPAYLSACDWGFIAVKPYPSKRYCSPIKSGEYWAAGLPIIIPEGVSDDYELTKNNNLGITFNKINANLVEQIFNKSMGVYSKTKIMKFVKTNRDIQVYKKALKNTFDELLPQT